MDQLKHRCRIHPDSLDTPLIEANQTSNGAGIDTTQYAFPTNRCAFAAALGWMGRPHYSQQLVQRATARIPGSKNQSHCSAASSPAPAHLLDGRSRLRLPLFGPGEHRRAWSPTAQLIRNQVSQHTGWCFNSLLLNLYRNGKDAMGFHADNEPELDPKAPIAPLSFASRTYVNQRGIQGESMSLEPGTATSC